MSPELLLLLLMKKCKVKGCRLPHQSLGYCNKHYKQQREGWDERVDLALVKPVFDRLVEILGTRRQVAIELGTTPSTLSHILNHQNYIHQKTFDKALALLAKYEESNPKTSVPLEVVDAEKLAEILGGWVVKYLADRPSEMHTFAGPTGAIAFWSGVSEKSVSRYVNNTGLAQPWVSLSAAEKLLIAINEELALRDGRLEVFPNPSLSLVEWSKRMRLRGCY